MDRDKIIRQLKGDMPIRAYNKQIEMTLGDNRHWGQRKLLLSEIEFLTIYYDDYGKDKEKILLYIGSAEGYHINYLIKMFPELTYHLYDKRKTYVKESDKVKVFREYFTDEIAKKYIGKNVFIVCDIRNLEIRDIRKGMTTGEKSMIDMDNLISGDMIMQKIWCDIIQPKRALLKFRLSYEIKTSQYYDGRIFIQPWAKNTSTETRLVPDLKTWKTYDNSEYEQRMFYFNTVTRRDKYDNTHFPCLGKCYDCMAEANILRGYIKRFEEQYTGSDDVLDGRVCDISTSITLLLGKYMNKPIKNEYIIDVKNYMDIKSPLQL